MLATDNAADRGGGLYATTCIGSPALEVWESTFVRNRARTGGGVYVSDTQGADFQGSVFTHNSAMDSGIEDEAAAQEVEGGGLYCEASSMQLHNNTWRENNASSPVPGRAAGGALAAHGCVAELSSEVIERNSANEAGGILWRGAMPLVVNDGAFVANEARLNRYSAAILWGADSANGELSGGGLALRGCTSFADAQGNALSFGELCSGGRRRLTDGRRQLDGAVAVSAASLGISTPVDRLEARPQWEPLSGVAESGHPFPSNTEVHALDAYNNTMPTASGVVTALPTGADICDTCQAVIPLVGGIAVFSQLGLLAPPGSQVSMVFSSARGAPTPPMRVHMASCAAGTYLDSEAKICRPCPAGASSNASAICVSCAEGKYADHTGATTCSDCAASEYQPQAASTACLRCPGLPASYSSRGSTGCTTCHSGASETGGTRTHAATALQT